MSIDSVFVHKMWNDNELSKMVEGGVPFPCYPMPAEESERFLVSLTRMPVLKPGKVYY